MRRWKHTQTQTHTHTRENARQQQQQHGGNIDGVDDQRRPRRMDPSQQGDERQTGHVYAHYRRPTRQLQEPAGTVRLEQSIRKILTHNTQTFKRAAFAS